MATGIHIPYRCPNCGDSNKFNTLQELRTHLQTEHCFGFDRSQRWSSLSSFNHGNVNESKLLHHSSLLDLYRADAKKLEESLRNSKEEEQNNKRVRSEYEGLASSRMNAPNRRAFGSCPPKATFREYGHSSRLNKHLYPKKYAHTDNRFEHHHIPYSSDEDLKSNNENVHFAELDQMFSEQMNQEAFHIKTSHTNSEIKSYTDKYFQPTQNQSTDEKHIIKTLNTLSHDVLLERASQQATANSLYTTQEVLSGIEQAAEERLAQQQVVTYSLAKKLKEKENRLNNVMHEVENLHTQQLDSMEKMSLLKKKYENENKQLHQELQQKQRELDSLSKQITETTQSVLKRSETTFQEPEKHTSIGTLDENNDLHPSFHIHSDNEGIQNGSASVKENIQNNKQSLHESPGKEKELTMIKNKAQQLERDKQNLLMEMQNLLETAATDNDKLRLELDSRTEKLSKLNCDLELSKQEQAELLDETNALYHQADVSLSILKTMLKEREHQLVCMSVSLEQAKSNQEKLIKEKDEYLMLAKEREVMYRSTLAANSSQVKSIKENFESSQEEKLKLKEGLRELREQLAAKDEKDRQLTENVSRLQAELVEKEKAQAEIKDKVRRREEKLKKAKLEMERVTNYLNTTAEKELDARYRLEAFISSLIDRAGKAEAEVRKLKSRHVPSSSKKLSKGNNTSELAHHPGVSSRAYLQDKLDSHGDGTEKKAGQRLDESQPPFYSTPDMDEYTTSTSYLQHPPQMNTSDKNRSSTWVVNHSLPSSRYNADLSGSSGQQRSEHLQDPEIIYRQYGHPETSLYPSAFQPEASHMTFDNTPEVNKMFENVRKFANTKPVGQLHSQKKHRSEVGRVEQHMPVNRQHIPVNRQQKTIDLSLDDNGIMWEQSSQYPKNANSKMSNNYIPLLRQRAEPLKINDDTDIDEDLTDYVVEEEKLSHEELKEAENLASKSNTVSANKIDIKVDTFQKVPIKSSEKSVKLQSSLETEAGDSLIQNNSTNLKTYSLQQTNLNIDEGINNMSHKRKFDPLKAANDYSTTESTETSPLNKARAVQKRVEQLTSVGSSLPRASSSSKQSDGFEVNHLDGDSDFSSSSYASLVHPDILSNKEGTTQYSRYEKSEASNVVECLPNTPTVHETKLDSKNSNDINLDKSVHTDNVSKELNLDNETIPTTKSGIESNHSNKNVPITQAANINNVSEEGDSLIEKQPTNSFEGGITDSLSSSADHVLAGDTNSPILQNHELAKYTDAELKPAKELRTQNVSQREVQTPSSEDDLFDNNLPPQRQSYPERNTDASTDTDLEKVAMPGYLQKNYIIKKYMPSVKRSVRRKPRPKVPLKKYSSQESASSDPDGLRGRGIMAEESPESYELSVRGSLEAGLEKFLSTCHDTMTELHISDCENILTDKCLWLISGYCRLLTTLTYLSSMDPITPQVMWALGGGCPGITSLFVHPQQPCRKSSAMNNRCLLLIGQLYQDILELGLGGKEFDKTGIIPLVQSCQRLKSLHLDHCQAITADLTSALCKAGLKQLHTLTISGTFIEAKAIHIFKENCRQLKGIHVTVSIQDCVDDPNKKKDKETYQKMVKELEALKAKLGFGVVFTLKAMPVN